MGDISTRASSVGILARDLEAQSQTTGFESRQTASQKLVNREIGLNQKDTQVRNVSEVPTSEFYKAFISYHHPNPDKGPHHCLFICWGPPGSQWAIDIPVINLDDEVQIFKDIRNYWFKHRGQWRRLLPFYGVLAVKEVKFRFVHRHGTRYAVLVKHIEEKTEQRRRELGIQIQDARTVIRGLPSPQEDAPRLCSPSPGSGSYDHLDECPESSNPEPLSMCPFEKIHESERELRGPELQQLLTLCFHNPEYAGEQYTLSGVVQGSSIYKYSYIGSALDNLHKPRVADLELSGLYVEEGHLNNNHGLVSATAILLTGTMVVSWELRTGDWNTAFALGSFLVGMVAAVATLRHL